MLANFRALEGFGEDRVHKVFLELEHMISIGSCYDNMCSIKDLEGFGEDRVHEVFLELEHMSSIGSCYDNICSIKDVVDMLCMCCGSDIHVVRVPLRILGEFREGINVSLNAFVPIGND